MRRRRVAIVAATLVWLTAASHSQAAPRMSCQDECGEPTKVVPCQQLIQWQSAVYAHEPGQVDNAVTSIGSWDRSTLSSTVGGVVTVGAELLGLKDIGARQTRIDGSPKREDHSIIGRSPLRPTTYRRLMPALSGRASANAFFKRAAMLHADIALAPDDLSRRTGEWTVALVRDGQVIGSEGFSLHWNLGRHLISLVLPSPADDVFAREWYRATLSVMLGTGALAPAVGHVAEALVTLPDDANIWFEAGRFAEAMAQMLRQVPEVMRHDPRGLGGRQHDAVSVYRRAWQIDSTHVEARIHLGHALLELDRADEAARELAPACEAAANPRLAYLCAMFLGRAEEQLTQFDSAASRFRRAAELRPTAQSPLLALSRLARQSGNKPAARQYVRDALRRQPEDGSADPWWEYFEWQVQNPNQLMQDLWALARLEPRS
jgi:tetratricopeptide (TPR) repeat protein